MGGVIMDESTLPPNRPFGALADLIRHARVAKGLSQRQLSRAMRKSEGYVGHLERGIFRPDPDSIKALSVALELSYGELCARCASTLLMALDKVRGSDHTCYRCQACGHIFSPVLAGPKSKSAATGL